MLNTYIHNMKALKCKTLGAKLAYMHTHCIILYTCTFYADDHLPNLNARR